MFSIALSRRFLDVEKDIHSVCSLYTNFRNCKDQYFANLALKFNAKLGGVNHIPSGISVEKLRTQGAMLVGADVTHPGSSSIQGTPSIVAVVATVGKHHLSHVVRSGCNQSSEQTQPSHAFPYQFGYRKVGQRLANTFYSTPKSLLNIAA
jgi:hypothetical protein